MLTFLGRRCRVPGEQRWHFDPFAGMAFVVGALGRVVMMNGSVDIWGDDVKPLVFRETGP